MASGKIYYTNTQNKILNAIINYSTSIGINFPTAGGRYLVFTISATGYEREFGMVSCDSGGSVNYNAIYHATNSKLTFTTGSRLLTIANADTTYRVNVMIVTMSGDLPTVS